MFRIKPDIIITSLKQICLIFLTNFMQILITECSYHGNDDKLQFLVQLKYRGLFTINFVRNESSRSHIVRESFIKVPLPRKWYNFVTIIEYNHYKYTKLEQNCSNRFYTRRKCDGLIDCRYHRNDNKLKFLVPL